MIVHGKWLMIGNHDDNIPNLATMVFTIYHMANIMSYNRGIQ